MSKFVYAVTGASGYFGKHLVNFLRQQDYIVYELGRSVSNAQIPEYFLPFFLGETTLPELQNVDVLIHCAYDFSARSIKENEQINLQGSRRLFQYAKKTGVKHIIFISSISAYKDAKSIYGKIKYAIENEAASVGASIIRPGLIFGDNPKGIVGAMLQWVKNNAVVPLIGRGNQLFYVSEIGALCHLTNQLANTKQHAFNVITATANKPITFKELLILIAKKYNKKIYFVPVSFCLIWLALKILELSGINLGFRSDSLVSAQYYNKEIDFSPLFDFDDIHFPAVDELL
ncbi:MAG: hypothetical protein A3C44_03340 [Gammaproteobacteria bacterium RIFCSPHIGHO2_02_FULL_39_13]|nr:MAG: hypothetical protein A3C44_03340 [Gammaproteobacteria bacterium RIFCSPHIGHO2_02_FULL_39_13]OGT48564.1 MAG: hypothetical protein A3E53_04230 [Gammaproteobacteria bacterium RIFCSPHIGHO2_12_FULL_39_24]